MQMPGEALLLKMWETLIEKGIGGLVIPYYTVWKDRKFALNKIELDKQCRIATFKAEQEISQITNKNTKLISYSAIPSEENESELSIRDTVLNNNMKRLIREEINVAKAINYANERLIEDESNVPKEEMSQDWLNTWRDNASKVSDEEVQSLWGNVLAQEYLEPGRYSLRLLEFLRTMSKSDALLIEKTAPFVSELGIVYGRLRKDVFLSDKKFRNTFGITNEEMRLLEEIGLVSGVSTLGDTFKIRKHLIHEDELTLKIPLKRNMFLCFSSVLKDNRKKLFQLVDNNIDFEIGCYKTTKIGKEIFSLVDTKIKPEYVQWLAMQFEDDFEITIHKIVKGKIRVESISDI